MLLYHHHLKGFLKNHILALFLMTVPMIEVAPFSVADTTASSTCLEPVENLSISNTPTGLCVCELVTNII